LNASDIALVRIQQFYPLDGAMVLQALSGYAAGTYVGWCQA